MTETIAILDLETTGVNTETCEVVEVAALKLRGDFPGPLEVTDSFWSLVKPEGPIPPEASAVHHLVAADLAGAPSAVVAMCNQEGCLVDFMRGVDVAVGHNINNYDAPILERLGVSLPPLLDTLRLAHHAWPQLEQVGESTPSYGLEALRFRFGLAPNSMDWAAMAGPGDSRFRPHGAAFDVSACRVLLDHCVEALAINGMKATTYADLAAGSLKPYRVHVMPFGKHRGENLSDVPRSYLSWALGNMKELDADLAASMRACM
jgi:exodeoxyribonuclease X